MTMPYDPVRTCYGSNAPDAEISARLVEHRCVWCGQPIPDRCAPEDCFDRDDCQHRWREWKDADVVQNGVSARKEVEWTGPRTEPPPSWLGPQPHVDYQPVRTPVVHDDGATDATVFVQAMTDQNGATA